MGWFCLLLGARKERSVLGGGGGQLGSEPLSSRAAAALQRAEAALRRAARGWEPAAWHRHNRPQCGLAARINQPIHWEKPEFSGSRLGVTCAGCLRVCAGPGAPAGPGHALLLKCQSRMRPSLPPLLQRCAAECACSGHTCVSRASLCDHRHRSTRLSTH